MKYKLCIIVILLFVMTAFQVNAESNITAVAEVNGRQVSINGEVLDKKSGYHISLVVGESLYEAIYIFQTETDENGRFNFNFTLADSLPAGIYKYKVGSLFGLYSGSTEYYEGTIEITDLSIQGNLVVNINNYVPTISGTVQCYNGRKAKLDVLNITDGTILITEKFEQDEKSFSCTLPNLLKNKDYRIILNCDNGSDKLLTVNAVIDSDTLLLTAGGDINVSDSSYAEIQLSSTTIEKLNTNQTIDNDKSFSETLPNLAANFSVSLSFNGYETGKSYARSYEKHNITLENNYYLYLALLKAVPELDPERDKVITVEELSSLTGVLDLSNMNIDSVDGLQACENITQLYLNNNRIANLEPLSVLDNLTMLIADHNNILTITMLPPNLRMINLEYNGMYDGRGISVLENAEYIYLGHNQISDVSFLNRKTKLRYLTLDNNHISDISYLADSNALVHLDLSDNSIININVLNDNTQLKYLKLSNNEIDDISSLPDILYHSLYVDGNYITADEIADFSAISKMYISK